MHTTKYFISEEKKIKEKFKALSKIIGEKGIEYGLQQKLIPLALEV